jgi:hypothetical protein
MVMGGFQRLQAVFWKVRNNCEADNRFHIFFLSTFAVPWLRKQEFIWVLAVAPLRRIEATGKSPIPFWLMCRVSAPRLESISYA